MALATLSLDSPGSFFGFPVPGISEVRGSRGSIGFLHYIALYQFGIIFLQLIWDDLGFVWELAAAPMQ